MNLTIENLTLWLLCILPGYILIQVILLFIPERLLEKRLPGAFEKTVLSVVFGVIVYLLTKAFFVIFRLKSTISGVPKEDIILSNYPFIGIAWGFSVVVGFVIALAVNWIGKRYRAYQVKISQKVCPNVWDFIFKRGEEKNLIFIRATLSNGTVYIGKVISVEDTEKQEIVITDVQRILDGEIKELDKVDYVYINAKDIEAIEFSCEEETE